MTTDRLCVVSLQRVIVASRDWLEASAAMTHAVSGLTERHEIHITAGQSM